MKFSNLISSVLTSRCYTHDPIGRGGSIRWVFPGNFPQQRGGSMNSRLSWRSRLRRNDSLTDRQASRPSERCRGCGCIINYSESGATTADSGPPAMTVHAMMQRQQLQRRRHCMSACSKLEICVDANGRSAATTADTVTTQVVR